MDAKQTELEGKLAESLKRAADIACQIQAAEQGAGWDAALRRYRNACARSWPTTEPVGSGEPGRRRRNAAVHRNRLSPLWTILPRRDQQAGSSFDGWPGRTDRNGRPLPSLSTVFFSLNVNRSDSTLENPHRDSNGR